MRDRTLTPFFPMPRDEESSVRRPRTPHGPPPLAHGPPRLRRLPARELEGSVVGEGRFLLLRKLRHTTGTVTYSARDLHGGIEVEVEVRPDPASFRGYTVGTQRQSPARPSLPNLICPPITTEVVLPRERRRRMRSWIGAALRRAPTRS